MATLRLTPEADADIVSILEWSDLQFGEAARARYRATIVNALADLAADPFRPASRDRSGLIAGLRSYHIGLTRSRRRERDGFAKRPRHILFYSVSDDGDTVAVFRVLHDAMDPTIHLIERDQTSTR